VGLAKRVGVTDPLLIKAIEAAALLHDMGKLAVPEYILNKPGKLTPVEFEKMKLHATVGADILSAIKFPYPVVPIVRHHHENWDGTGYPSRLKGTDIPIGARILSVVDCFDALTSDRPYRPRLADKEAIDILLARRGSMYDPLIVDTFIKVHAEIAPDNPQESSSPALKKFAPSGQGGAQQSAQSPLDNIAASSDEMLTLFELTSGLANQGQAGDTLEVITKHLRRLVPFSLCVFFAFDKDTDELEATHVNGDGGSDVRGMRIALGQRLSGWVAANRQTIVNSDPALDFGELARTGNSRLRSCLSTSLVSDGELVGVLSLYSGTQDAFGDNHRRVIEDVGKRIAQALRRAAAGAATQRKDDLPTLGSFSQIEQLLTMSPDPEADYLSALLFIDVAGLKEIEEAHGRTLGDSMSWFVVQQVRASLRTPDTLFRYGNHEFAVLLHEANRTVAAAVADRIRTRLRSISLKDKNGLPISVDPSVTVVCSAADLALLQDLLDVSRSSGRHVRIRIPSAIH
jgi:diguanylate cyclase (GGDEF)-like protein/putative nucleotidyltransferase with HDIG domain